MKIIKFLINNIDEMKQFAHKIVQLSDYVDVITLRGDLGAGKTFFAQSYIKYLIPEATNIVSPTFLIAQNYCNNTNNINHFDLYRLKNPQELVEIGIEDSLISAINLIEWPEIAEELLPENRLDLFLEQNEFVEGRNITAHCYGSWEHKLNE